MEKVKCKHCGKVGRPGTKCHVCSRIVQEIVIVEEFVHDPTVIEEDECCGECDDCDCVKSVEEVEEEHLENSNDYFEDYENEDTEE